MPRTRKVKKAASIRKLESSAANGDLKASYQLYLNYRDGRFVEQDETKAEEYLSLFLERFSNYEFKLSYLKLVDFRLFKHMESQFNLKGGGASDIVIIGDNGAGKTSILDAIAKSLSYVSGSILSESGSGKKFDELDINNESETGYTSVISKVVVNDRSEFLIDISKTAPGVFASKRSDLEEFKLLGSMFRLADSLIEDFNLPIMAYYSVARSSDIEKIDLSKFDVEYNEERYSKYRGYDASLNGVASFRNFFLWFKRLDELSSKYSSQLNKDLLEVATVAGQLELIQELKKSGKISSLEDVESILKERLGGLQAETPKSISRGVKKEIDVVSRAIESIMPGYSNLRVERNPLGLFLDKDRSKLDIFQLSQGEKALISMVADIARRLVLLNPGLEDPLAGKGIILIDEIDLHLHPKWQQEVLMKLNSTFPNVQFVVTTHSPQVITTVHRASVHRVAYDAEDESFELLRVTADPFGTPSNEALHGVMHVDPLPPLPEIKKYRKLVSMLAENQMNQEFMDTLTELKKDLGSQHTLVVDVERTLRRKRALDV